MKEIDEEAFAEDAKGGMVFINLVKKYGISPARCQKLRNEALGVEPETVVEEEAPEAFDITINVPADRMMDCIRGTTQDQLLEAIDALDAQSQANIFQQIMQKKFDRLLSPSTSIELPTLSLGEET